MVSKPWRQKSRPKQPIGLKIMELEQTVKDVQATLNGNGTAVETPALLKEIAELKAKLTAALEQGAMDAMKARRVEAVEAERDTLKQQLDTLTPAQPMTVAVTSDVECSIQYDVKAPDMARWRNAGWQVKHYQFVDNDRRVPTLAVVMERPVDPTTPLTESDYRYSVAPKADAPDNSESSPMNEPVSAAFTIIIEEPEAVPAMTAKPTLMQKLAADKPIFAAISEYGVDAVLDAMDAQVYEKARAAYDAYAPADTPPRRFESMLLNGGDVSMESVTPDTIILEADEIEVVLS